MNKFVHTLFSFNPADKISISHIQRLASLMSRTSILSRHMRPYTHTMHVITSGYNQFHAKIHLSDLAQSDVMMWRAFVLLLIAQPDRLLRTMESFRPQSDSYCIKYDASLTGLGVGIYNLTNSELITYAVMALPFEVSNESKRQNTMEFIAVVLGLLLAWRASLHHFTYNLHGDSISSLAWAKADWVNSTLARQTNINFTTISVHLPFVQLLYRWATTFLRNDSDPFLSFRSNTTLHCLLYKNIQSALKSSAKHFNLDEAWFNTQSIRMKQHENRQRPSCAWVVGKQYRPQWNIRNSLQQSIIASSPSPAARLTSRRKTSYCREHWQLERTVPSQLCRDPIQLCDVSDPLGSVNHVHREDTMCRQEVGEHESPM